MQVVRTELPRLKYLDGYIKLPAAKGAVFAELLPTVAVRRVGGNSTLYSVVYRRPKRKAEEKKKSRVSSPLIVTLYQSDVRAKTFRVLLKMKVDVRLMSDEHSYRFGVAMAVDEVAECVFVAYTRDEPPVGERSAPGTRLLLRRVHLMLAAADERGVRRLQRPGVTRRHQSQCISKIFEARTYFGFGPPKVMASSLKAEEGIVVQQLAIDKGSLLLYVQGFGSLAAADVWPVAQLELNEKRASMDVRSVPPADQHVIYGLGRRKFGAHILSRSPREVRLADEVTKPYWPVPFLTKLGPVADAACHRLEDAIQENSVERQQIVGGPVDAAWWQVSACRGRQVFLSSCSWHLDSDGCDYQMMAVRGLATIAPQPQILSALSAGRALLSEWQARNTKLGRLVGESAELDAPVCKVIGGWLLGLVSLQSARQPLSTKLVILRASLRSLLPPKTVCANCHVAIRPSPPDKKVNKKVCKVCRIRGFGKYSWVFGCHYCSAACLRDAWPVHSLLHKTPPIRKWTDDDWKQWRLDNSKQ